MGRYGYLDMPDGYSDVSSWSVQATCLNCQRLVTVIREDAWRDDDGNLVTDCMCSELPDSEDALG